MDIDETLVTILESAAGKAFKALQEELHCDDHLIPRRTCPKDPLLIQPPHGFLHGV